MNGQKKHLNGFFYLSLSVNYHIIYCTFDTPFITFMSIIEI